MKVVLLGMTGSVTAIARDPEKLKKHDGLIARTGDVYDTSSLAGLPDELHLSQKRKL